MKRCDECKFEEVIKMGIQALPSTTVRAIGASQVLNDPAAVIKELVDNALDARATSIAVDISNNTLDTIQVRDNGHGIAPEDRLLVAKPHCTSKITSEDELKSIGGSSLGFRGEALASVAELSGSLTISTRVEGEQVAVALKIDQNGEVESQERASLPIGTTVNITDFIKAHPVRRKVALKNTEKTSKKIKETLQCYAFARPQVRLSLRFLKAKTDKGNWTYAPKPGGNAEDAAFKIVGAACASQCTWSVLEDSGFTLQAFLPRVDADVGKVSSIGSFLSVDSRPVSASRGTAKRVVKIFRETLKKANKRFDGVKEPFIYLEIVCRPASYDANVEPAKDDVLFEDPDVVVLVARRLFEAVYPVPEGERSARVVEPNPIGPQRNTTFPEEDDFVTSLGSCRTGTKSAQPPAPHEYRVPEYFNLDSTLSEEDSPARDQPLGVQRAFRNNMYGCDEEDLDLLDERPPTGRTDADFEELRQAQKDVSVSNPWVMAKLNASLRRPMTEDGGIRAPPLDSAPSPVLPSQPSAQKRPSIDLETSGLPTPRPSSPSPPSQSFHPSNHVPDFCLAKDGRMIDSQALPPPQMVLQPPSSTDEDTGDERASPPQRSRAAAYHYTLSSQASEPPAGTPLGNIPSISAKPGGSPRKQQSQINMPFVSPMKVQQGSGAWSVHAEVDAQQRPRPGRKRQYQPKDSTGLIVQGELGDLAEDPRPLTPPRRNRDMRDFVTSLNLTANDSAASLIESRNYPQHTHVRAVGNGDPPPAENGEENAAPASGVLSGRGFIPAGELAAMEAHLGSHKNSVTRPTKRRKISESRVLRTISGNATTLAADDQEYQPGTGSNPVSRRRSTTGRSKSRRTKSSQLPLERVPTGQRLHNVVFSTSATEQEISRSAGKVDEEHSLLSWNEAALDAYDTFAAAPCPRTTKSLTTKLRELLISMSLKGEIVQDLEMFVQDAFVAHAKLVQSM